MIKPEYKIDDWSLNYISGNHFGLKTTYVLTGYVAGHPCNHPRVDSQWVRTSQIQSIDFVKGVVETMNTTYVLGPHEFKEPSKLEKSEILEAVLMSNPVWRV